MLNEETHRKCERQTQEEQIVTVAALGTEHEILPQLLKNGTTNI